MYRKTTNFPEISLKLHYTFRLTESKHHIIPGVSHSELQIKPLRFQAFCSDLAYENRTEISWLNTVVCAAVVLTLSVLKVPASYTKNKQIFPVRSD